MEMYTTTAVATFTHHNVGIHITNGQQLLLLFKPQILHQNTPKESPTQRAMGRKKRTSMGRKKIAMERIANEEARQVCFSKRRGGLFTKASDLVTLCGAELAIVVYSPAGNPYSFGSPAVNPVVDCFLSGRQARSGLGLNQGVQSSAVQELNRQCMELSRHMDMARARKVMLEERLSVAVQANQGRWFAEEIDKLGLKELEWVEAILLGVRARVNVRIREASRGGEASSSNMVRMVNPMVEPRISQASLDGDFKIGFRFN